MSDAWQPIATAPKDGTAILICLRTGYLPVRLVSWEEGFWEEPYGSRIKMGVRFWQPLPTPPEYQP